MGSEGLLRGVYTTGMLTLHYLFSVFVDLDNTENNLRFGSLA